ncbi:hypothetical protein PR048_017467 [Dryococelus australis]|uniref:Uncharacterized protein n=1 Tax=Dryococelus australis TaxID=614101 RepID=A0ABQ9H9N7_9NEOP|nr:hypothetical protein PR048_017467 [Dryococelus australis]
MEQRLNVRAGGNGRSPRIHADQAARFSQTKFRELSRRESNPVRFSGRPSRVPFPSPFSTEAEGVRPPAVSIVALTMDKQGKTNLFPEPRLRGAVPSPPLHSFLSHNPLVPRRKYRNSSWSHLTKLSPDPRWLSDWHARLPPRRTRLNTRPGHRAFRKWESCRTMPLVGGLSRGSPIFPAPSLRRRFMFTSITLIGSQDLAVKSSPNLFTTLVPAIFTAPSRSVVPVKTESVLPPFPHATETRRGRTNQKKIYGGGKVNKQLFVFVPLFERRSSLWGPGADAETVKSHKSVAGWGPPLPLSPLTCRRKATKLPISVPHAAVSTPSFSPPPVPSSRCSVLQKNPPSTPFTNTSSITRWQRSARTDGMRQAFVSFSNASRPQTSKEMPRRRIFLRVDYFQREIYNLEGITLCNVATKTKCEAVALTWAYPFSDWLHEAMVTGLASDWLMRGAKGSPLAELPAANDSHWLITHTHSTLANDSHWQIAVPLSISHSAPPPPMILIGKLLHPYPLVTPLHLHQCFPLGQPRHDEKCIIKVSRINSHPRQHDCKWSEEIRVSLNIEI